MFITLEGVEGSGKSTQAARLVAWLREAGHLARRTREPGGTALADAARALVLHPEASVSALRGAGLIVEGATSQGDPAQSEPILPATEVFLFSAARAQHVARIRGWLAAGEVVVCDRFADTTRAYQGYGRGLDLSMIAAVEHLATGGLHPNMTLLFDVPAEEGQRRKRQAHAAGSEWNRLDAEALGFLDRVRAGYLAMAAADPARWVVLDARLDPDALGAAIWEAVAPRLSPA